MGFHLDAPKMSHGMIIIRAAGTSENVQVFYFTDKDLGPGYCEI